MALTLAEIQSQRLRVVEEARRWLGTPWRHLGRVRGAGVDCGMLLAEVYEACGLCSHLESTYPNDWMLHRDEDVMVREVEIRGNVRAQGPGQPGDIALFRHGRCIAHGALVVEWPLVIHAYVPVGMVCLDDAVANRALGRHLAGFWHPAAWEV